MSSWSLSILPSPISEFQHAPLSLQSVASQGTYPNSLFFRCLPFGIHIWVPQGVRSASKWLFPTFPWKLWTVLRPWTFLRLFQIGVPTHAEFINKWSFWNGFWTPSGLFSPWRFLWLFQLCYHIVQGHIPPQIARVFGITHILAMIKPSGGVHPIIMGITLYQLTSRVLCLQFYEIFTTHFFSHQFGVAIGCEVIIHDTKCTLNLHPNWVVF